MLFISWNTSRNLKKSTYSQKQIIKNALPRLALNVFMQILHKNATKNLAPHQNTIESHLKNVNPTNKVAIPLEVKMGIKEHLRMSFFVLWDTKITAELTEKILLTFCRKKLPQWHWGDNIVVFIMWWVIFLCFFAGACLSYSFWTCKVRKHSPFPLMGEKTVVLLRCPSWVTRFYF